jgi:hypothetical protein
MTDCATSGSMYQTTNSAVRVTNRALRNRPLAGVLTLVYVALLALAGYLESIRIEQYWPIWLFVVAVLIWFAIMMVLPFVVIRYFFGLDLSLLWQPLRRFSLGSMLIWVFYISLFLWYFTQMEWLDDRRDWRRNNPTAVRTTEGKAPLGLLRLMGDPGESRIEIKNGTKNAIAEAKRLFPEATVVAAPEPVRTQGNN